MCSTVFSEMLQFGVWLPWGRYWGCGKQELGKKGFACSRCIKWRMGAEQEMRGTKLHMSFQGDAAIFSCLLMHGGH